MTKVNHWQKSTVSLWVSWVVSILNCVILTELKDSSTITRCLKNTQKEKQYNLNTKNEEKPCHEGRYDRIEKPNEKQSWCCLWDFLGRDGIRLFLENQLLRPIWENVTFHIFEIYSTAWSIETEVILNFVTSNSAWSFRKSDFYRFLSLSQCHLRTQ